jgi:predicted transcriptional regulator
MAPRTKLELGAAELDALKVLWDRGPSTVRQVHQVLHSRGRRVAYTTVLTFLVRLEQKGLAASDKSAHAYVFRARVSRQQVTQGRLKAMVRDLFDGAAATMVLQLMSTEKFSADEIAQLQRLIDEMDSTNKRPG